MDRAERLSFRDRVVVVTGSGSGLGRAYALALASRGACVVVNGRREAPVLETVEQVRERGGRALPCVLDVSEKGAGETLVAQATDAFGRLDAVVNNAGVGHVSGVEDFSPEAFESDLRVSVVGSLSLSLAAWPRLRAAGSGRIVNTSSSAIFGIPRSIPYATAKAALLGLTRALAQDGAAVGIRVNAVMPLAATEMNAKLPDPELVRMFREHFPVEEAAALVLLLCHERAPCSGESFVTGGGFTARADLALGPGIVQPGADPETLLARIDEVRSLEGARGPDSSGAIRRHIVGRLRDAAAP